MIEIIFRFSAFLFLRLIVPGILYPKMHNLVNGKHKFHFHAHWLCQSSFINFYGKKNKNMHQTVVIIPLLSACFL